MSSMRRAIAKSNAGRGRNFRSVTNSQLVDLMLPFIQQHMLCRSTYVRNLGRRLSDLKLIFLAKMTKLQVENVNLKYVIQCIYDRLVAKDESATRHELYRTLEALMADEDALCNTPLTVQMLSKVRRYFKLKNAHEHVDRLTHLHEEHKRLRDEKLFKKPPVTRIRKARTSTVSSSGGNDVSSTLLASLKVEHSYNDRSLLKKEFRKSENSECEKDADPMWNAHSYFPYKPIMSPLEPDLLNLPGPKVVVLPAIPNLDTIDGNCLCGKPACYCHHCKRIVCNLITYKLDVVNNIF